jgi:hypothetical protein
VFVLFCVFVLYLGYPVFVILFWLFVLYLGYSVFLYCFVCLLLILYIAVSFLFSYKFIDRCQRLETQLQSINIVSYDGRSYVPHKPSAPHFQAVAPLLLTYLLTHSLHTAQSFLRS